MDVRRHKLRSGVKKRKEKINRQDKTRLFGTGQEKREAKGKERKAIKRKCANAIVARSMAFPSTLEFHQKSGGVASAAGIV